MRNNQRRIVLFLVAALLFNYPLISLFNQNRTVLGFPVLYAYMFIIWAVLIIVMALLSRSSR